MANATDPARTLPLTVVTGFLGAGKTTLVNALLRDARLADTAVLINEFGSVGIDHHLVEKIDDKVLLLASGCLCCSARGDLARALRDLFMRRLRREIPRFSRVLVETTGLADPAPVLATISGDFFLAERYRIDGVVTVIDAMLGEGQLARHVEAVKQAAMADRLLLAKCDLAPHAQIAALHARLDRLNPGAPLREMANGEVDAAFVLGLDGNSECRPKTLSNAMPPSNAPPPLTIYSSHSTSAITLMITPMMNALRMYPPAMLTRGRGAERMSLMRLVD